MFDIITFGSATRDVFLRLKKESYQILKKKEFPTGKGLCFSLSSKIEIEDLIMSSGGGGTNSAATFASQGFKTAFCGKVGKDKIGEAIIKELKKFKVSTVFIKKDKKLPTAYSVILSSPQGTRTILVYRAACHFMKFKEIPWKELKAKWFYIAPLSDSLAKLFGPLVKFAKENGIKIAANLGNSQINLGQEILKPILSKIDIIILNQEEASLLTKIPFQKEKKIFQKLNKLIPGIVLMTKAKKGAVVSDGKYIWKAGTRSLKIIEKTGAGDAFGAGFVTGFIKKNNIAYAIQLATANAFFCIQKIGAKNGLLKKGRKFVKIKVQKKLLR